MKFLKYLFIMFLAIGAFSCNEEPILRSGGDDDDDPIIIPPPPPHRANVSADTVSI
ncbi:hypothetical protein [Ohtaekwangia sp.]|uniref:hypothetical protein n=1 Tax=Ohtaekwangia sp. TaxID=2066019 RepID=UPI002F9435F0